MSRSCQDESCLIRLLFGIYSNVILVILKTLSNFVQKKIADFEADVERTRSRLLAAGITDMTKFDK